MVTHDTHGTSHVRSLGPGQTIDRVDQLSSVVLLGLAVAGSVVAVFLNALVN